MIRNFLKVVDNVSKWSGLLTLWLVLAIMIITVMEVVARHLFGSPQIWAPETVAFLYGVQFMLAAAYTLWRRGHVSVDVIYSRWSEKTQAIVSIINYVLFFFPWWIVLFYVGSETAISAWQGGHVTVGAGLPIVAPMKTVLPITAVLIILQGLAEVARHAYFLSTGRKL
ncbi:TRAP transporter small permease subunit [Dehalococcoidia bacterium]|nr:TRAP transporter small permease subunit [Dehalococcoidia bacterium]MCL0097107.1 TRAP transporter small permease subunit [Dehalococcoidia bacterium]